MKHPASILSAICLSALLAAPTFGQENIRRRVVDATVDTEFVFDFPALEDAHGTTVLIDRYHDTIYQNEGMATGATTLLGILETDGFAHKYIETPLLPDVLAQGDMLFIHGLPNDEVELPNGGTFWRSPLSDEEIEAIVRWVDAGGGLFLTLSHFPNGSGGLPLLEAFAVKFRDGYLYSEAYPSFTNPANDHCSHYFGMSAEDKTLNTAHPVVNGPLPVERVDFLCGAAIFRNSDDIILGFPAGSANYDQSGMFNETSDSYAGMLGFDYGLGRVIVAGDQGLFRDFIFEFDSGDFVHVTITGPENDNANLFVNMIRWLSPCLNGRQEGPGRGSLSDLPRGIVSGTRSCR